MPLYRKMHSPPSAEDAQGSQMRQERRQGLDAVAVFRSLFAHVGGREGVAARLTTIEVQRSEGR